MRVGSKVRVRSAVTPVGDRPSIQPRPEKWRRTCFDLTAAGTPYVARRFLSLLFVSFGYRCPTVSVQPDASPQSKRPGGSWPKKTKEDEKREVAISTASV